MERDRRRIAKPSGASEEQPHVSQQKIDSNIEPARGAQHHDREKSDERRKPDAGAPLPGRNPHVGRNHQQNNDRETRRIENVLAVNPQQEFR